MGIFNLRKGEGGWKREGTWGKDYKSVDYRSTCGKNLLRVGSHGVSRVSLKISLILEFCIRLDIDSIKTCPWFSLSRWGSNPVIRTECYTGDSNVRTMGTFHRSGQSHGVYTPNDLSILGK